MTAIKMMAVVKFGLFLFLSDLLGVLDGMRSENEDIDSFQAMYFELPCCTRNRHVRHHKGKIVFSSISEPAIFVRTVHLQTKSRSTLKTMFRVRTLPSNRLFKDVYCNRAGSQQELCYKMRRWIVEKII